MAKIGKTYRTADVDTTQRGGDPLPDGIYEIEVESAEPKKSKKGGEGVNITYEVFLPEKYRGRKFFQWINTIVPGSPKAEEIGEQEMSKLIRATGFPEDEEFEDTDDLLKKPFVARVGVDKEETTRNKIWRFYYPDEEQPQPNVEEKRQDSRSRERAPERGAERSREREPSREQSRGREERGGRESSRDDSRGRERDERGRDERDNGGRSSHGADDERDSRRDLDDAAEQGSREVERGRRGGDGSENPWQGRGRR